MSDVLFDVPGPKARRRHQLYTAGFVALVLVGAFFVVQRFRSEGVLTSDVANDTFQNSNVTFLLEGLRGTLKAAALAIVGAIVFGALFAVGRLSNHAVVRLPCTAVIEFFRAVPLVLLILIIWFSFKDTIGTLGSLVAGLTLYNGSVLAEVFRAGVNAVNRGQSEAAYAIGMRKTQVMTLILMPQAVKFMLPAIISQCVIVLKDTSLGYIIVYPELVRNSRQVAQFVNDGTILVYVVAALMFIAINYSLSKLAEYVERRLSRRGERPLEHTALEAE
ncbi:MAG: amino acid ABC transporter permease [Nocardioidaceae bacterium]